MRPTAPTAWPVLGTAQCREDCRHSSSVGSQPSEIAICHTPVLCFVWRFFRIRYTLLRLIPYRVFEVKGSSNLAGGAANAVSRRARLWRRDGRSTSQSWWWRQIVDAPKFEDP